MGDLPSLLLEIQGLVDGHADDPPERLLERVEHTLTDGYAQALALEGEQLRLERDLQKGMPEERAAEVRARLEANASELRGLRELLGGLRLHAQHVRSLNGSAA